MQQHGADVFIVDHQIVLGVDLPDDFVVHGDDPALQAAAELQVGLAVSQQQHIGGKTADVDDEDPGQGQNLPAQGDYRGIRLGIDQHPADFQGQGSVLIGKLHNAPLEVLGKLLPQHSVMLRGQAHRQICLDKGRPGFPALQFPGNGEQGQHKVPVILSFVPHIGDALSGKGPEAAGVFQHFL